MTYCLCKGHLIKNDNWSINTYVFHVAADPLLRVFLLAICSSFAKRIRRMLIQMHLFILGNFFLGIWEVVAH